jgi:hypothetical protein
MIKTLLIIISVCLPLLFWGQQTAINIASLGAVGDGKTDNTFIIQKAIDQASESGNGKVVFPEGRFLTGVLHLKSNVELNLQPGAVLLGSANRADYGPEDASALIDATNQNNIAITGQGVIDGQGDLLIKDIYAMLNAGTLRDTEWQTYNPWLQLRPEERNRPKILRILGCDGVVVKGVTIKNGLCWIQDYRNSANIVIDSIRVESTTFLNNDGIDLTDCTNVRVTNCFIDAADDGICLKSSTRDLRCENIYVANCQVRSSASALKLGTASHGGFKNITIRDITVWDTYRSAIAIEAVDGGVLENVDVQNISAKNTGNAICIRLGHRNTDPVISQLRNVHIAHLKVEIPSGKPDKGYPEEGPPVYYPHNVFPSSVTGIPGHPVENVTIEDIELIFEGGGDSQIACIPVDSLSNIPEQIAEYPEFSMFGELPAWGFYVRHVDGLVFRNMKLTAKKTDYRPAFVFDDVKKLTLDRVQVSEPDAGAQVIFRNVRENKLINADIRVRSID